jgi:hypothetical protein
MALADGHLNSEQRHTLARLQDRTGNHNVKWPQVLHLLESLGQVVAESGDRYRVTIGSHTVVVRRPSQPDISADLVGQLRQLFDRASAEAVEAGEASASGDTLLVVVDHHSATIYRLEEDRPAATTVRPEDPHNRLHHLHHIEGNYAGQRTPERAEYYREIARAVQDADTVLIFGHGSGHSDAARLAEEQLVAHRSGPTPVFVIDANVDASALTENQLIESARKLLTMPG